MRIAIVTFFDNGNYGSELQAIAMNSFCEERGHRAVFLKIKSKNKFLRILELINDEVNVRSHCIINREYKRYYEDRLANLKRQENISESLRNSIRQFMKKHIEMFVVSRRIFNKAKGFDCYICGSDQIWSALKMPIRKEYFLCRIPASKKIAYAPSFGLNQLPQYFIKHVVAYINDFRYLSVREDVAKEQIKESFGREAELVLDPTMLVDRDFWNQFIAKETTCDIAEPYVLCYFLGRFSNEQLQQINRYANGKLIISLPYIDASKKFVHGKYVEATPVDFVKLIRDADFVFTDSFHGSVFSIIFNKPFVVYDRTHVLHVVQSSRICSLLKIAGIPQRFCKTVQDAERCLGEKICYKEINDRIHSKRVESISFLDNSLLAVKRNSI